MRIAIVSDTFARRTRFGLARYSHEIRKGLARREVFSVPVSSMSEFGASEPEWLREAGFRRLPFGRKMLATTWSLGLPWPRLERWLPPVDLVHSLDIDYPVATTKPWVVTFHDLGVLTQPQFFGKAWPWLQKSLMNAAVNRAAAVICVSQATADEFNMLTACKAAGRVRVIEEGVGEEFFEKPSIEAIAALPAEIVDAPFFLFTGSISPRKNLARVIAAFGYVAARIPHRLVLTGAHGWDSAAELAALKASTISDRIIELGYVSDVTLRALYAKADGFLYPSLYEGFGLPILEAMGAGCPVVTSNIKPMTEVAGEATLLVDPRSVDDIAGSLIALAEDGDLRALCRYKGLAQARRFSWGVCVDATIEVYRSVLGDGMHG